MFFKCVIKYYNTNMVIFFKSRVMKYYNTNMICFISCYKIL